MKKEQRMMLQGGVTYEEGRERDREYIASIMYEYPKAETKIIEMPLEYYNPMQVYTIGKPVIVREERYEEPKINRIKPERRNEIKKPARERIDYINKAGNVKDFGVPQVNENIVMKAKTKKIQTPSKDYNEIASLMYPTMEEKSQIQVKKKEPMLLGESSVLEKPDMITLADKEYEVKPIDKKEENKDKEMKIEQVLDEKEIIQKENKDVSLNQNVKETFEFIQKNGFAPKKSYPIIYIGVN